MRKVRRADWRRSPAPTRTSVCSTLVKERAPCSAARVSFHDRAAEPSAGRNPCQPAWASAGTIGDAGLNVTSAPNPSSRRGTTAPAGIEKSRDRASPSARTAAANAMSIATAPARSATRS